MKNLKLFVLLLIANYSLFAQVGIGTVSPNSTAALDITSTSQGLLLPRMNTSQRTAISSPATGLLVFQTDGTTGFYYYTGSAWVNLNAINLPVSIANGGTNATTQSGAINNLLPSQASNAGNYLTTDGTNASWTSVASIPAGTIVPYAGSTAPTGWLLCTGAAVSRTTYSTLFGVTSTTYGSGDGSTTFNLPDLRGRAVFGKDNMGGTAASRLTSTYGPDGTTLGATGGAQSFTMTTTQLPSHTHSLYVTGTTDYQGNHYHNYQDAYYAEGGGNASYGSSLKGSNGTDSDNNFWYRNGTSYSSTPANIATDYQGNHYHNVTASGTSGSTGSGSAFSLVNPGIVLNYIIKY